MDREYHANNRLESTFKNKLKYCLKPYRVQEELSPIGSTFKYLHTNYLSNCLCTLSRDNNRISEFYKSSLLPTIPISSCSS